MYKIYLYVDRKKQYRWRMVARNGRILADCGQGYSTAAMRDKGLNLVRSGQSVVWYAVPPSKRRK